MRNQIKHELRDDWRLASVAVSLLPFQLCKTCASVSTGRRLAKLCRVAKTTGERESVQFLRPTDVLKSAPTKGGERAMIY